MSRPLCWISAALLLAAAAPVHAQRDARVPDPDVDKERQALQLAEGFEINLFAADPLLAKPVQMNFDSAGRLWVACSAVYPQLKPGEQANDRIVVLEDTHGTGHADKATVFAEGLLIPTGLVPGDGGVYVANSTELLHLSDTDGDGKADKQRVVLSGFGTEDTHHILHTLRWGPDGQLYFNQSIYIHSHIETPNGVRRLAGGGVWQFRPETMHLEVFARGWVNPWGHHFDRWGQSFVTDGAGGEGINYVVPGAGYAAAVGMPHLLQGLNPGSPKYCGEEIISGRALPEDWQGNIITNDFRAHRVCRFVLREDGSGYAAQEKGELIKTNHESFRPVDVKMGPDGAIYIADWYSPIIQHGEVDFRDPRRDHVHGRIWRITYKGKPALARPQLVGATTEALLDALKVPEDWTRQHAKLVLKERGAAKVLPVLAEWVKRLDPADPQFEHNLLEALWTYQALDVVEPNLLNTLLHARDHHARAAATRVVGAWQARLPNSLDLLSERVADDHPQVRLEAVRSLGQVANPHAVEVALRVLDRPVDRFLDYALWLTVRDLEPQWLPALEKGEMDFSGNVRNLTFVLQAANSRSGVQPLVNLVRAGKVAPDREEGVLTLIASLGGPHELSAVLDHALAADLPAAARAHLLEALATATTQRRARPEGNLDRLARVLTDNDEAVRSAGLRLAGLWQVEALRSRLLDTARGDRYTAGVRQAAIEGLALLGGPASKGALAELAGGKAPVEVRRSAVIALASLDLDTAAQRAVEVLGGGDPTPVFAAFLEQKNGPAALARALASGHLDADAARIGVRTARASGRDVTALVEALTKAGSLTSNARQLSDQEMQQLLAEVRSQGDPARGEAIFRRQDLSCLKCHAIGGAGGQVGPDLASIGASAPMDYLVDSLLLPNKAVKENYHALVVGTSKGQVFTGIKVRETATELVLRTAEDKELSIPTNSIEERSIGGSLMPEGLTDTLTRGELVDLVRFLSELGKVGPYAIGKGRVVRRWQALDAAGQTRHWLESRGLAVATTSETALIWNPAYSTVAGTLPLALVPVLELHPSGNPEPFRMGLVRCQVDATTGGKVKVLLNAAQGLRIWLDQTPVDAHEEMVLDLTTGLHTLTFAVDVGQRKEPLRCELEDVPGSPARAQVVGGK